MQDRGIKKDPPLLNYLLFRQCMQNFYLLYSLSSKPASLQEIVEMLQCTIATIVEKDQTRVFFADG